MQGTLRNDTILYDLWIAGLPSNSFTIGLSRWQRPFS